MVGSLNVPANARSSVLELRINSLFNSFMPEGSSSIHTLRYWLYKGKRSAGLFYLQKPDNFIPLYGT